MWPTRRFRFLCPKQQCDGLFLRFFHGAFVTSPSHQPLERGVISTAAAVADTARRSRSIIHRPAIVSNGRVYSYDSEQQRKNNEIMAYYTSKKMSGNSIVEMKELASRICRDYLHGAWKYVNAENIGFVHVSGGLSNFLYQISLPDELLKDEKSQGEPKQVLFRIYGHNHGEGGLENLITDSVIFTLLAERGLGPKLFGLFPGGRIEEYINARPLLPKEMTDARISVLIAQKMAAIHQMEVPLYKDPRWLWETMENWLRTTEKKLEGNVPECMKIMQDVDLKKECSWLKELLEGVGSPVVFCHNDMQKGNILIMEDEATEKDDDGAPRLVLIDFEYCSYNYRAFDIANHFCEWMYNYTHKEHPYFTVIRENAPTKEQKLKFIRAYLDEQGSKEDPEKLLEEVEVFTLGCHLLWSLWGVVNADISQITFGHWEFGCERFKDYLLQKEALHLHSPIKRKELHD